MPDRKVERVLGRGKKGGNMKKLLALAMLVFICCTTCSWAETSQEKISKIKNIVNSISDDEENLWNTKNINKFLCDRPEAIPVYTKKWVGRLAWNEFCPYCSAFSYYHLSDRDGNRKCVRCTQEWKPKYPGNYSGNGDPRQVYWGDNK
jgi:hypothetical protein